METFNRIYFGMVIVCVCLPANSNPMPLLDDSDIGDMKKNVICEQDSKFYTPTNIKPECLTAALQCFKDELQTVKHECKDPQNYINRTKGFLEHVISTMKNEEVNSNACSCESYSEEPFPEFLNAMETLVQRFNSKARQNQQR
uniref:Interleukin n=1 Tax=Tetraodon nigroviridis TaxID=99883 RepID=B2BHG8_TETNG|nr:interleukin-2 [Tetraodon nigroviridis]